MALNIKPFFPLEHPTAVEFPDLIKLEFYLEDKNFDLSKQPNNNKNSYSELIRKKTKKLNLKRKLNII